MAAKSPNKHDNYVIHEFTQNLKSMEEIGDALNISRQRVQQILQRNGLSSDDGGKRKATSLKQQANNMIRAKKRADKIMKQYGCDEATLDQINSGWSESDTHHPSSKYLRYKRNLGRRNIDCELSLPDWYAVWQASGEYLNSGVGGGKFAMVRKDNDRPATVDNVVIVESSRLFEYHRGGET